MRKSVTLFLSLLLIILNSFGQKPVFSYQPFDGNITKKSFPNTTYTMTDDKTGKTALIIKSDDQVEYVLLSKDLKMEAKVKPAGGLNSTIFKDQWYRFIGGITNNLGNCFFYAVKDNNLIEGRYHIRMEIVDFKDNSVSNKMIFVAPADEHIIDYYTINGTFVLLASNDKTNTLIFHIMDENGEFDSKTVPFDLTGFNKDKLKLSEYLSYSNVYRPDREIGLVGATNLNKIYVYPDKVIMVVANLNEPPHIWTIDTHTYTLVSRQKLDMTGFTGFNGKKEKFYTNASLYGKDLYVLNTSKNKTEIGIFDLASGKLINKHEVSESTSIPFADTPAETITKARHTNRNEIKSIEKLCKELSKGTQGIAVGYNKKGEIVLTCGVYDKELEGGTYTSYIGFTHSYSYYYTRTVSFKIILNPSDMNVINSDEKLSGLDKISAFILNKDEKTLVENSLNVSGKNYVCYYEVDSKTFNLQEIEL